VHVQRAELDVNPSDCEPTMERRPVAVTFVAAAELLREAVLPRLWHATRACAVTQLQVTRASESKELTAALADKLVSNAVLVSYNFLR